MKWHPEVVRIWRLASSMSRALGGAGLGGDGGDVASNESVVGGGGDDGSHIA